MHQLSSQSLRKKIQQQRLVLEQHHLDAGAMTISQQLKYILNEKPGNLAIYLPIKGEVPTEVTIELARNLGWKVFLPVCKGSHKMDFHLFEANTTLNKNQYHILEPQNTVKITAEKLDLVIVPIVAYDKNNNRLGMGSGFYDRYFSFRRGNKLSPKLCGLAWSFQYVESLVTNDWDVPMDRVLIAD